MDTNPIFDFLYELETQRSYKNPSLPTLSGEAVLPWQDYVHFLRRMQRKFEACVFQCVAEIPSYLKELPFIADRLRGFISITDRHERTELLAERNVQAIVSEVAEGSLCFLRENYGIEPKSDTKKEDTKVANIPTTAPFLNLNLSEDKAAQLYDTLVQGSYLADTGKTEFIYYFTGVGEPPKDKLKWKSDAIILSILIKKLTPNRMPWKELSAIFDGLNIDSMRTNLSKELAKYKDEYEDSTYERHAAIVDDWLKD